MSNFEKLMAGKHVYNPPYQNSEIANSIIAEFEKCFIPAPSSAFNHCGCSCHGHGDDLQSATTALEPDAEPNSKLHGNSTRAEAAKMGKKDFMASIDRVRPLTHKHSLEHVACQRDANLAHYLTGLSQGSRQQNSISLEPA